MVFKMDGDRYHILFGAHSNFPLCCIAAWMAGDLAPVTRELLQGVGYRPCRECIEGHWKDVVIHRCTAECVPFAISIGGSDRLISNMKGRKKNEKDNCSNRRGRAKEAREKRKTYKDVQASV